MVARLCSNAAATTSARPGCIPVAQLGEPTAATASFMQPTGMAQGTVQAEVDTKPAAQLPSPAPLLLASDLLPCHASVSVTECRAVSTVSVRMNVRMCMQVYSAIHCKSGRSNSTTVTSDRKVVLIEYLQGLVRVARQAVLPAGLQAAMGLQLMLLAAGHLQADCAAAARQQPLHWRQWRQQADCAARAWQALQKLHWQ
jgi:hypothetical protein